jgi:hypothetical protein
MRRTLAIFIKAKGAPESIQGKQRIQFGLVIALFITQRPERGTGASSGATITVPEACGLKTDWFTDLKKRNVLPCREMSGGRSDVSGVFSYMAPDA